MSSNGSEGVAPAFLRLEDLLLPPPLPAIVALLIVLGTLYLSRHGARRLSAGTPSLVEFAATFVLTAGMIAAVVHALAWAGYASVLVLRLGGWALAALGVAEILRCRLTETRRVLGDYFSETSFAERCALALSIATAIGLFSAALGPVVDADSLDYHLGV